MTDPSHDPRALLAPEYRAYLNRLDAASDPPLRDLSLEAARRLTRDKQRADVSKLPVTSERHIVDDFSVTIFKPERCETPLPVVLYLHGGGWVVGDEQTYARLVREIALSARAAVVFVEYQRAPEAPFPKPLEQCYRALTWVAQQGSALGFDPSRIAVAGDSAGGNLAAALCLLAKERGGPSLRLQALLYPVTDCNFDTPSYREFSTGLNLDLAAMRWFWDQYVSNGPVHRNPLASPLCAPDEALRGLPPALVITAECDVLRDEGEAYAHKLAAAGVRVASIRLGGVLHGFLSIDELARTPQAEAATRLLASELHTALQ